ncbi:neutral zinc metallopeptidase [Lewinella sp. 4G2]|uniref:KPN_02809 family neutral zinc metallopeptidase n=1 Tax=Lewinella sp. 4G2 TaxID=1803372 RepID=UPI0007B498AA|nr:neutral zinc metallopeptidase [Lewinella sp. 4G2]OAV45975.1 metalloprotease [Lewinella sp. 4G2]
MKLEGRESSRNIDDRRGGRSRGGMSRGTKTAGGIGLGSIIIAIIVMLLGGDPGEFLGVSNGGGTVTAPSASGPSTGGLVDDSDPNARIVGVTLRETEKIWSQLFPQEYNRRYQEPTLVLFTGQDRSACGFASAATGPFYCPADQQVYIDLSFADLLRQRFKAPGDFALAYVVAHEVGHHIQNQLGYSQQVSQARRRLAKKDANAMSVRLELQADYLAGVWAHYADRTDLLSEGDIEEALRAASAIGDDKIQKQSQGYVVPDSFTHGSSEQRIKAFYAGYESGDASKAALDYFFGNNFAL